MTAAIGTGTCNFGLSCVGKWCVCGKEPRTPGHFWIMQILTTGKNLDIGASLREHIEDRLSQNLSKYFDGAVRAHVTVEKQKSGFSTDCTLHLSTGLTLQAHGDGGDAYSSFDGAAGHLEKRLRRYKRRLKDHHLARSEPVNAVPAARFVIASEEEREEPDNLNPVIVAEDTATIPELSVGEAVMQLEISSVPFVLFRNAKNDHLNVVYRRSDDNIGWIDPGPSKSKS